MIAPVFLTFLLGQGVLNAAPDGASVMASHRYLINTGMAQTRTTVSNDSRLDAEMRGYLFEYLKPQLKGIPEIIDLEWTDAPGESESVSTFSYWNFEEVTKKGLIMATIRLGQPITLMFEGTQKYRRCKTGMAGTAPQSDEDTGTPSSAECVLLSELQVQGPVHVYTTVSSSQALRSQQALNGKQTLFFQMTKSYDRKDTIFESRLSVGSMLWEKALMDFVSAHSFQQASGMVGMLESSLIGRHTLFLGVARMFRAINEGVLK